MYLKNWCKILGPFKVFFYFELSTSKNINPEGFQMLVCFSFKIFCIYELVYVDFILRFCLFINQFLIDKNIFHCLCVLNGFISIFFVWRIAFGGNGFLLDKIAAFEKEGWFADRF